jgi:Ca2+/Na+ antiporter
LLYADAHWPFRFKSIVTFALSSVYILHVYVTVLFCCLLPLYRSFLSSHKQQEPLAERAATEHVLSLTERNLQTAVTLCGVPCIRLMFLLLRRGTKRILEIYSFKVNCD